MEKTFLDLTVKSDLRSYDNIQKIKTGHKRRLHNWLPTRLSLFLKKNVR